jgi:YesN/AraC family two-component response regulator
MREIKVLIVDDEQVCIDELIDCINWEKLGISKHNIRGVNSVRRAMTDFQTWQTDIVICDIEMPNENGLDLIEWVTEWNRFEEETAECIMLTCHPEFSFIRRALQLGCTDYILKPYEVGEMETALQRAIDRLKQRDKQRRENDKKSQRVAPKEIYVDVVYGKTIPYINEHLTESFGVEDIARLVSLNPQYLMRLFKKTTGKSVLGYVVDKRMELAQEMLLKTDWPIEMITDKVGYLSSAHFSQLFKRVVGKSPGQYRKEHRK